MAGTVAIAILIAPTRFLGPEGQWMIGTMRSFAGKLRPSSTRPAASAESSDQKQRPAASAESSDQKQRPAADAESFDEKVPGVARPVRTR
jgi:hypothetical protein